MKQVRELADDERLHDTEIKFWRMLKTPNSFKRILILCIVFGLCRVFIHICKEMHNPIRAPCFQHLSFIIVSEPG